MNTSTNNYDLLNELSVEYSEFAWEKDGWSASALDEFGMWLEIHKNLTINGMKPLDFINQNQTMETLTIHSFILENSNVEITKA